MAKNSVVAVVVTYNRRDTLKKNIECLLAQQDASCDILIIDNASTDGTAEMIEQFSGAGGPVSKKGQPLQNKGRSDTENGEYLENEQQAHWEGQLHYVNTGSNLGGAGGFEYGLRKAMEYDYSYVWIMDDDSWPRQDALAHLLKADARLSGQWGFLSSAVYWTDGSLCKANKPKKTLFTFIQESDLKKDDVRIQMGSFVSMFIKTSTVQEVGFPHGAYFIWTDDYEYSGRIARKYPSYFIPDSYVVHAMKANVKADLSTDSFERTERYQCLYRNDVHCYRQYGFLGWCYIWLKNVLGTVKIVLKSKDHKKERIRILWKGYQAGLSFHPEKE